jgi:hypothetical protein
MLMHVFKLHFQILFFSFGVELFRSRVSLLSYNNSSALEFYFDLWIVGYLVIKTPYPMDAFIGRADTRRVGVLQVVSQPRLSLDLA